MANKLKEKNIILVIVLIIVTLGIYYPVWFLKQKEAINNLKSKEKLTDTPLLITLVLYSFSAIIFFYQIPNYDVEIIGALDIIDAIISLTGAIIMIFMSFKVRRIFDQYYNIALKKNIKLSKVWTFFLGIIYLQYKINRILESK